MGIPQVWVNKRLLIGRYCKLHVICIFARIKDASAFRKLREKYVCIIAHNNFGNGKETVLQVRVESVAFLAAQRNLHCSDFALRPFAKLTSARHVSFCRHYTYTVASVAAECSNSRQFDHVRLDPFFYLLCSTALVSLDLILVKVS
jgi:hypothetical protein